jgi:5,6,7,8-tetrahydromethanopterin hydro-lyase
MCYYDNTENIRNIYRQVGAQIYRKKTNVTTMYVFERVQVGEALVGEGPEVAHIDLVIGPRGSTVEQAFVNALASPTIGHTPLLAVLAPNLPAKPHTLMVNKVTIKGAGQALLIFGPAQAAVAKAVMDCVSIGTLPEELAEDLFIIVSVFIEWDAKDKKKVYEYNYQATKLAIERAVAKEPKPIEILAKKDSAKHPFA